MVINKKVLDFYYERKELETDNDKVKELKEMDNFIIDSDLKINLGEVYIITHEKKYEDTDDSYEYYEIFDKKNTDLPLIQTNEKYEMQVVNSELKEKLYNSGLDLEKNKRLLREMVRQNEKGELTTTFAIMKEFDINEKNALKLKDYYKKFKSKVVYNDVKNDEDKVQIKDNGKELSEKAIKQKFEAEGKAIRSMKLIEDPFFYQMVPDATVYTYCAEYADGSIGIINSHGEDITQRSNEGSLELRRMDRDIVKSEDDQVINTDYVLSIKGSSETHGIVFPIVKDRGNTLIQVKDVYDEDEPTMPLDMQYSENDIDIYKMSKVDELIIETLKKNGIMEPDKDIVKKVSAKFYQKGIDEPDEISIIKEHKRTSLEQQNNDSVEENVKNNVSYKGLERGERFLNEQGQEE